MSRSSRSRTKASAKTDDFNPAHQLPGKRPFVVQPKSSTKAAFAKPNLARMQQLDRGVMQALRLSAKSTSNSTQNQDNHNLTAPRFAGDPVLEACYDNEQRLNVGSNGTAVVKLQQALLVIGFSLPEYGVDGKFGPETKAAVIDFQKSVGFSGQDVDGIVGPKTMGALDTRFGKATPKGPRPKRPSSGGPLLRGGKFKLKRHSRKRNRQLAAHKKNVAFVKKLLTQMKKPRNPPIVSNTAEWLYPSTPGATARSNLYILTPTHDTRERAEHHGLDKGFAFFGIGNKFPDDSATYDAEISSKRNIRSVESAPSGSAAGQSALGKDIFLYDPKFNGRHGIKHTLIHEVQHLADREGDKGKAGSPEWGLQRYKDEFRAYWVENNPSLSLNKIGCGVKRKFDNAKQKAIFCQIYKASDHYGWFKTLYDENAVVPSYDQTFQELIHAHTQPEGTNLINSPRIDVFLNNFTLIFKHTTLEDSQAQNLASLAHALTAEDRDYINSIEGKGIQDMMKQKLNPEILQHIATIVNNGEEPTWAQ